MAGCGVQFVDGTGWLEEKLKKRTEVGTDALTLYAHSIWGAKCRVQRYIDADTDIIYMTAVAKPSAVVQICLHLQWIPGFHRTLRQTANVSCLTIIINYEGVENRGSANDSQGADGLGYVYRNNPDRHSSVFF